MTPAAQREALQAYVGQTLHERYRIDAVLGMGGMGGVFRAHHLGLHQDVALKMLHATGRGNATARGRFEREARAASRLDHPNCVRVSDFGALADGTLFLVMQLLRGEELRSRLGTPWAPGDAIWVAMQVLDGLAHAHRHGVVHRDLKPENVFLTTDHRGAPQVKLVDFGIAKILEDDAASSEPRLTRTGMSFGTPRYMSPEQVGGGKVDARTDLYAVGLLLYEMIAGKPPFEADNIAMVMRMHILADPPPLPERTPASLIAVVMKLLAKSPVDRFESADATMRALEAIRSEFERDTAAAIARPDPPPRSGGTVVASASTTPSGWASTPPTSPEAATFASHAIVPAVPTMPTYGPAPQDVVAGTRRRRGPFPAIWVVVALALLGLGAAAGVYFGEAGRSGRGTPSFANPSGTAVSSTPTSAFRPAVPPNPLQVRACSGGDCRCRGSDACNLQCGDDCDLKCSGSKDCNFVCGEDCEVKCEGSGNCTATAGHDSKITCSGPGRCNVACRGECSLKCRGPGRCTLQCAGPDDPGPKRCKKNDTLSCGECD